ncbi:MAG: hypothetical protein ACMXYB_04320 [Candidatus Woesearchaeota archaeon]
MIKKQEITNSKKIKVSWGSYLYNSMLNYFLTIFFIFGLMLFLLLLIILSREVLADASIERHLIETKSLLEELDKVERGRENRFDSFNSNISQYEQNSIFNRVFIDDLSLLSPENSNISFVSMRFQDNEFELIENRLIVTDIDFRVEDYILYISNFQEPESDFLYSKGLILEIIKDKQDTSIIEEIVVLKDVREFESQIQITEMNHNDFFEVILPNQIIGVVGLVRNDNKVET